MPAALHPLPLAAATLPEVAAWLLARRQDPGSPDLADMLVLLPSRRACDQLAHALLDRDGRPALLLPRLATPAELERHLDALTGGGDGPPLPEPALRPLLLAPRLARLDWLRERPEAALGLAHEMVAVFDELRRARCEGLVLEAADDRALLAMVPPAVAEVLRTDLARIRSAWRCYRAVLPEDQVDRRCAALARAAGAWPGPRPALVAAAHVGRLDQVHLDLLRALPDQGVPVHWLTAEADDPRSRLLLASYRGPDSPAHPLRALGRLAERLGLQPPAVPSFTGDDLPTRLAGLAAARAQLAPGGPLDLRSCRDPEHEARVTADTVCRDLADAAREGRPAPAILVATADRGLAARIVAHLRDAGVDVDDTRGRPLATLPAGRLVRDLLRTVVGGWAFAPLFEVLTHPYVRLVDAEARPSHAVRVQVLEAAVRRVRTVRRGLDVLRSIAADDDAQPQADGRTWSLAGFVDDLAAALAPLAGLAGRTAAWSQTVAALRGAWSACAPDRPLDGQPDPLADLDDVGALAGLLDALDGADRWLEPASPAEIAAAAGDLLGGPGCEVRPHRRRHLPVRVVGLVEARLESADLLVLPGLAQDVFPGRLPRPLLLPDALRDRLRLATWRSRADLMAELFLRLLHVAPRVVMTWPRERDGRDALPSPPVQRLVMTAGRDPAAADEPPLRRRAVPDAERIARVEQRHAAEPEPIPAPRVPPPATLSHTALQRHRECPYRFLLASGLGLRRPDPLEAAFGPADAGTLAHEVMCRWLAPGAAGWSALADGDGEAALAALRDAGDAALGASTLPGRALALQSLLSLGPDLVAGELERAAAWQPAAVEACFRLTLGDALDWLRAESPDQPPVAVPDDWRAMVLQGKIDRIDRRRDGTAAAAVLDYKTGPPPAASSVRDGRELQLHLYALAVEVGGIAALPPPAGCSAWRVEQGGFYGLGKRPPGLPGKPHLADRRDLVAGVRAIVEEVVQIRDPQAPYALVPRWKDGEAGGQLPCRYCEFLGVCRLEEREASQEFTARLAALLAAGSRRTA